MANLKLIVALFGLSFLADANPMATPLVHQLRPRELIPTPAPRLGKRTLQKRGYVPICPSGQTTGCPSIGINEITSVPGGQYIPECDSNGSCHWIGYATPTDPISGSSTYELVTSTGEVYVVPVPIVPIVGAVPPPPPVPPPADLPPAEEGEPVEDPDPEVDCTSLPMSFDAAPFSSAFAVASTLIDWWGQFGDFDFSAESAVVSAEGSSPITAAPSTSATPVGICGSTSTSGIPGCWGQPGCAYYLAGNGQGCPGVDYCMCDGTNVGLLTTMVSGTATSNCAYTTQPTANDCPTNPASVASSTAPAVASSSPTPIYSVCMSPGLYDMRQAYAMTASASYCASFSGNTKPLTSGWPGQCDVQNVGAVYQPPANGQVEAGQSDISFVTRQDVINDYCKGKALSDLVPNEDDCNTAMGIAINGCDTSTRQTKHGGSASVNCILYSIYPAPFGNGFPCSYLNVQPCIYGWISPCKPPG